MAVRRYTTMNKVNTIGNDEESFSLPVDDWVRNLRPENADPPYWDITLSIGKKHSFKAHKNILAAAMPWFKSALQPGTTEHENGEVKFREAEVSSVGLNSILSVTYGGEITINANNVIEIHASSDFLGVDSISLRCVNYMAKHQDALQFWPYATTNFDGARIFQDMLIENIRENFAALVKTVSFVNMDAEPLLQLFTLQPFDTPYNFVLDAALRWLNHMWDKRHSHVSDLMQLIDWYKVNFSTIRRLPSVCIVQNRESHNTEQQAADGMIAKKLMGPPQPKFVSDCGQRRLCFLFDDFSYQFYTAQDCVPLTDKISFNPCHCIDDICTCIKVGQIPYLHGLLLVGRIACALIEINNHYFVYELAPGRSGRCITLDHTHIKKQKKTEELYLRPVVGGNGWICFYRITLTTLKCTSQEKRDPHFIVYNVEGCLLRASAAECKPISGTPVAFPKKLSYLDNTCILCGLSFSVGFNSLFTNQIYNKYHRLDLKHLSWQIDCCSGTLGDTDLYCEMTDKYIVTKNKVVGLYFFDSKPPPGRQIGHELYFQFAERTLEVPNPIHPISDKTGRNDNIWQLGDMLYSFMHQKNDVNGEIIIQLQRLSLVDCQKGWSAVGSESFSMIPKHAILME